MGSKSKAPGHKSHVKRKRSASHTPDKGTYVQREHKDRLSGLYSGTGRNCFNYIMRLTNRIMTMRQSLLSRHWKTYSIWAIKMMWRFCWNRFCSWGGASEQLESEHAPAGPAVLFQHVSGLCDREKQKAYGKLQASARLFAVCSQDTRKTGRGISSG